MKVLIVEQDPLLLCNLVGAAGSLGCEVKGACTQAHARECLDKFEPHLVLLDMSLTDADLLETARRRPNALVVLMASPDREVEAQQALGRGAGNYVRKPIPLDDVKDLVRRYADLLDPQNDAAACSPSEGPRSFTIQFRSDAHEVPRIVNSLLGGMGGGEDEMNVRLGLLELLMNAVEHGNLEITNEEKEAALDQGLGMAELYAERLARPELAARKVTVAFSQDEEGNREWLISDEGKGFDWRREMERAAAPGLECLCGRGVLLARLVFDELQFLGRGNQVRVRKYAAKGRKGSGTS